MLLRCNQGRNWIRTWAVTVGLRQCSALNIGLRSDTNNAVVDEAIKSV